MKVWNYVFIMVGVMVALTLAGFDIGGFSDIFNIIGFEQDPVTGNIQNITTTDSGFADVLFRNLSDSKGLLIALGIGLSTVIAGLFTRAKPENLILVPFITTTLVLFADAFQSIARFVIGQGQLLFAGIITMIMLPFTVGFLFALAEFFRGTD